MISDVAITNCQRTDQFQTYLMYKPAGENSIWIPLKKMTWFWSGEATKGTNDVWNLDSGSSPTVAPVGIVTYEFPDWNSTFQDAYDMIFTQ